MVERLTQAGGAADLLRQIDGLAAVGEGSGGKAAMSFQRRVVAVSDVPGRQVSRLDRDLEGAIER